MRENRQKQQQQYTDIEGAGGKKQKKERRKTEKEIENDVQSGRQPRQAKKRDISRWKDKEEEQ